MELSFLELRMTCSCFLGSIMREVVSASLVLMGSTRVDLLVISGRFLAKLGTTFYFFFETNLNI